MFEPAGARFQTLWLDLYPPCASGTRRGDTHATFMGKTTLCSQILLHAMSAGCIFWDSLVLPEEHGL